MNCPECGEVIGDGSAFNLTREERLDLLREHFKVCTSQRIRNIMDNKNSMSNTEHMDEEWEEENDSLIQQEGIMIDIFRMQKEQAGHLKSISTALWVIVALMSIPMIISLIALLIMFT